MVPQPLVFVRPAFRAGGPAALPERTVPALMGLRSMPMIGTRLRQVRVRIHRKFITQRQAPDGGTRFSNAPPARPKPNPWEMIADLERLVPAAGASRQPLIACASGVEAARRTFELLPSEIEGWVEEAKRGMDIEGGRGYARSRVRPAGGAGDRKLR